MEPSGCDVKTNTKRLFEAGRDMGGLCCGALSPIRNVGGSTGWAELKAS